MSLGWGSGDRDPRGGLRDILLVIALVALMGAALSRVMGAGVPPVRRWTRDGGVSPWVATGDAGGGYGQDGSGMADMGGSFGDAGGGGDGGGGGD